MSSLLPQEMPGVLIICIFLCILCLLEGAYYYFADSERIQQRRLKKRLKFIKGLEVNLPQESLLKKEVLSDNPFLQQHLKKIAQLGQLRDLLVRADLNISVAAFLFLLLIAGFVGLAVGFYKFSLTGGLVGGVLGLLLPIKILSMKIKRRLKKFEKQLPEALDLLARGLKAGHAFASGLQLVASEMANPLGLEFFKTFKEYNHGLDLNTALLNLCHRVDLRDLRYFTTAVMIQRETGGNLTEILEKIAQLIRERFKLRNQIMALTAEGRLSGWVLILMPPGITLALFRLNPDYIMMLYNHPLGRMMAGAALFFQVMGMLFIRNIVNIKI